MENEQRIMSFFHTYFKSTESFLRFLILASIALIVAIEFLAIKIMNIKFIANSESFVIVIAAFLLGIISYFMRNNLSTILTKDGYVKFAKTSRIMAYTPEGIFLFSLFASSSIIMTYIAAASPYEFYDYYFNKFDKFLGFDTLQYINFINNHPILNDILSFAYHSAFQLIILFFSMAVFNQSIRIYFVILSLIFSVIICTILSYFFPAVDPITYLGINPNDYPNVEMAAGYAQIENLYKMRAGGVDKVINFSNLKGIIAFPSFHTSISVILAWSFWGVRLLRFPFLALNIVMLAAIPITGGHYLADMVAGAIIAAFSIYSVIRLANWHKAKMEIIK